MGTLAQACPGCGQRLTKGQVVCVSCGYHLADDRKLDTKVTRVKERVLAKRAKRRAESIGVRLIPHGVTLAQLGVLALITMGGSTSPEAHAAAFAVLRGYIGVGGLIIIVYAVREAGLYALISNFVVWWVLMADDANPYVLGILFNMGVSVLLMLVLLQGGVG